MTIHNNKPEENIEKCFEEIKQVLEKYGCEIYSNEDIEIYDKDNIKFYSWKDFDK